MFRCPNEQPSLTQKGYPTKPLGNMVREGERLPEDSWDNK